MAIFINRKGHMKGFTNGVKIIDRQACALISLVNSCRQFSLFISSNNDIIVGRSITQIHYSCRWFKTAKIKGGRNCNGTTNVHAVEFGTGTIKLKNAVIQ